MTYFHRTTINRLKIKTDRMQLLFILNSRLLHDTVMQEHPKIHT